MIAITKGTPAFSDNTRTAVERPRTDQHGGGEPKRKRSGDAHCVVKKKEPPPPSPRHQSRRANEAIDISNRGLVDDTRTRCSPRKRLDNFGSTPPMISACGLFLIFSRRSESKRRNGGVFMDAAERQWPANLRRAQADSQQSRSSCTPSIVHFSSCRLISLYPQQEESNKKTGEGAWRASWKRRDPFDQCLG